MGLQATSGVAAAWGGLGPGVLVRKVGKTPVTSLADFEKAIAEESAEAGVVLQVRTPRGNAVVLLKKEEPAATLSRT